MFSRTSAFAAAVAAVLLFSAAPAAAVPSFSAVPAAAAPSSSVVPAAAVPSFFAAQVAAVPSFFAAPVAAVPSFFAAPVAAVTVDPAAASPSAAQWSVSPASSAGPDGRISLRHTIDPGAGIDDAIAVSNLGADPATYVVAPGDGVVGDSGAFDIAAGDPQDSGAWITVGGLDAGAVTVAPGETRVLPVRMDVPDGATPGDHPAGIVVGVTRSSDGVAVTNRVGVRVHLQVAGDIVPTLRVDDVAATFTPSWIPFAPGVLRVETRVENSGNVRLGALAAVSETGVDAASLAGDPAELLPGDAATLVTETSAWPVFALVGTSTVRPVVLGDDAIAAPALVEQGFTTAAVSWSGLAALLLLAGAIVAVVIVRRRGRRRANAEVPAGAATAASESAGRVEPAERVPAAEQVEAEAR
ncbi:hypothetical protein [Microbacterium sp. VKM Ac-2923]|uniref:hypothetical protein n=1 Tax=Microbacterium sp. VKM Ac-2923 TaxID=2929476 RepID=UPI001FB4E69A|nr:hypothetical protein [Microbacterium sp. VKM Ac-2923]MCJ1706500.1 hypothetical protein [Microbacterium sp. VKM Ac-2923]